MIKKSYAECIGKKYAPAFFALPASMVVVFRERRTRWNGHYSLKAKVK